MKYLSAHAADMRKLGVVPDMLHITVRLFGPAADLVGESRLEYALTAPATLAELVELLLVRHPRLAPAVRSLRFAINEEYAGSAEPLSDGDEVAVIPPVAGGSDSLVELIDRPICTADVSRRVARPQCGAIVTFEGIVRFEGPTDNPLTALEYSAHDTMALRLMSQIRAQALERFEIEEVAMVHRTGRLAIGETSIVVAVSARHRAVAFTACQWIIDAVKIDVPIWKKEIWSRGEYTWVDPTEQPEP